MTFLTQGIIIKKSHSGDFDRQYVIYTRDLGKITATAKGAKKITSKMSPHLDFFSLVDMMIAEKYNTKRIAGARINYDFSLIKQSPIKISAAYLYLESLDNLTTYDFKDRVIFLLTIDFFRQLNKSTNIADIISTLNFYLFKLLSYSGYRPTLKVRNQRELFKELCKIIICSSEKELKSKNFLLKMIVI